MKIVASSSRRPLIAGCLLSLLPLVAPAFTAYATQPVGGAVPTLLRQMSGTWSVKEWMWPAPGAKAIDLPAAVAQRNLVDGKFLQESMTAVPGSGAAFNRIAYFDYNPVSGQYEYFSLDTRAPQMMNERSVRPGKPGGAIELYGSVFVASQWGSATNVPFRYRLNVGPIQGNTQTVELYLTPMGTVAGREFLAFRYLYTRRATR
ncbi:MAG TPA: DUF1579 family protein [Steroidobacteraceae bacterium]|nr:DUF1579 family protein [Steroidobacteraceae bacterium]